MRVRTSALICAAAVCAACGGDGPSGEGDGSGESTGIASVSDSSSQTRGESGEGSEGSEGSEGGSEDGDSRDESADGVFPKFDVGDWDEIDDCQLLNADDEDDSFSIIWIANSPEGTVSKIDTKTATEIARYATGPDTPDPSRTAVNLEGDVAVSNRRGTITKIANKLEDCEDRNGDGEITTSQAADDVLAWWDDECVLWHHQTDFDTGSSSGGPRATAWTGGQLDQDTCEIVGSNLWIGWRNQPETSVTIRKLDGTDGTSLGEVVVPDWDMNWGHGAYGGAADADGNLWALGTAGSVYKIDGDDFSVESWANPVSHTMYGIALDANGEPWIAGWSGNLWYFDTSAEEWVDKGPATDGPSGMRGLAIDQDGYAWIAGNNSCALIQYDTQADQYVNTNIPLPGCSVPVGVSIDVDGMVWVVDRDADQAYKVDPVDYSVDIVTGLVSPYTYSDMTGAGLDLVVNPPG